MRRLILIVILSGFYLFVTNIFAQNSSKLKSFINEEHKVKIACPGSWFIKEEPTQNIYMLFLSKEPVFKKTDIYKTGIAVYKMYNVDKEFWYVDKDKPESTRRWHSELFCQELIKKGQLISRKHELKKVGGKDAVLSEVSFKNDYGEKETLFNIVLFEDNTLINLIMEAPINEFENYRDIYIEIINKAVLF